jgi:hypothetical protein
MKKLTRERVVPTISAPETSRRKAYMEAQTA